MATRCRLCQMKMPTGKGALKRVEERVAADSVSDFYGAGLDKPLAAAVGPLKAVYHSRCYFAAYKRESKFGDAVTGNISGKTTTERLESSDAVTGTVTMLSSLPTERERLKAETVGGGQPYLHTHMGAVPNMAIKAHLQYAHGELEEFDDTLVEMQARHRGLHARAAQAAIAARRSADATDDAPGEANWRGGTAAEI